MAPGLYSQTPECNDDGCRGYFHRTIDMTISAQPTVDHNIDNYFWVYSQPETSNDPVTVTTGISDR